MKQKLIDVLSAFGYPVSLQGTLNPEQDYPETFITFWTNTTDDNAYFENKTYSVDWDFTVFLYSSNPAIVNEKPHEIREALKQAGFIPLGKGQDIPSDEPSHTGWAMDFVITEYLNERG